MDPRGTRKAIFLSKCNVDISSYLSSDHLSWRCYWSRAYHDSWDVSGTTHTHYHLSVQSTNPWKILPGTKVIPGYKFGSKHVINFQMAVEICFLFGKTIILLLSDRVNVISFAGFGYYYYFSFVSWVISNSKITYLYFVAFHMWISGAAIPIPRPKICSNAPS